jgi:hypothetical protein
MLEYDVILMLADEILKYEDDGSESSDEDDEDEDAMDTANSCEVCVFICSYKKPQRYVVNMPSAHCCLLEIDKKLMRKYLPKTAIFPTKLKKFTKISNITSYVYFAEFSNEGSLVSKGIVGKNIAQLVDSVWSTEELFEPDDGLDCLPFFYGKHNLYVKKKEKLKAELFIMKLKLNAGKEKAQLEAELAKRDESAEFAVKITELEEKKAELAKVEEELAKVEEELAQISHTEEDDYYFIENERTINLFHHLRDNGAFAGLESCALDETYRKPVAAPICQLSGGCDILFYGSRDVVAIEHASPPEDDPHNPPECFPSMIACSENKLRSGMEHTQQLHAEGYVMSARNLYFRIKKGLISFDMIKKIPYASAYASLFEVGGRAEIWEYRLNFENQILQRTLKFRKPLTEDTLSICYKKLIEVVKQ